MPDERQIPMRRSVEAKRERRVSENDRVRRIKGGGPVRRKGDGLVEAAREDREEALGRECLRRIGFRCVGVTLFNVEDVYWFHQGTTPTLRAVGGAHRLRHLTPAEVADELYAPVRQMMHNAAKGG